MAAVTPALTDLPKVSDDLKTQLEGFSYDQMKHATTNEKIVLPSAEGSYVAGYSTYIYLPYTRYLAYTTYYTHAYVFLCVVIALYVFPNTSNTFAECVTSYM